MASRRRCLRGFVCGPGGSGAAAGGAAAPHRPAGERGSADLTRASPAPRLARRHGPGRPLRAWAGGGPRREGGRLRWGGGGGCLFAGGRRQEAPLRGVPWALLAGPGVLRTGSRVWRPPFVPGDGSLPPGIAQRGGLRGPSPRRPPGPRGWNRGLGAGCGLVLNYEHPARRATSTTAFP